MQNAELHTQERQLTRFFLYFTQLIYKEDRTEPAVFLKTEPNLKNAFRTSIISLLTPLMLRPYNAVKISVV